MAEYIEREAAMLQIDAADFVRDDNFEGGATLLFCDDVVDRLSAIPAADVRPVVRGHWISEEEAEEKGDYSLRDACSVCGHCDWDCTESEGFNYCPNCGADMREES